VALAGKLEPKLFAEKCAGIYLNAGFGDAGQNLAERLEYNVALDPLSYSAIFALPCPVFWMPCFEVAPGQQNEPPVAGPYGTYYRFEQKEICRIFPPEPKIILRTCSNRAIRNGHIKKRPKRCAPIGCTIWKDPATRNSFPAKAISSGICGVRAGFPCRGLERRQRGKASTLGRRKSPAFTFDPVQVKCNAEGITTWSPDPQSHSRFLFHVRDEAPLFGKHDGGDANPVERHPLMEKSLRSMQTWSRASAETAFRKKN